MFAEAIEMEHWREIDYALRKFFTIFDSLSDSCDINTQRAAFDIPFFNFLYPIIWKEVAWKSSCKYTEAFNDFQNKQQKCME